MKIRLLTTAILLLSAGSVLAADWADARTNTPTTALPPAPSPEAPEVATTAPPAAQSEPAADITAPLRQSPPAPPSAAEAWAIGQAAPLNRGEIENVSRAVNDASRGRAWQPADVVPRISTLTVNLSPGASLPVLRTATHQASTVMFTDNTGAPWPLAAPPYNANADGFTVNYIPDSSVMTVQARRQYDRGNVTVYLKGLAGSSPSRWCKFRSSLPVR
ncbi:DotH/IcmK family type IV secretion protein [Candidatus Erwinia dacicola]